MRCSRRSPPWATATRRSPAASTPLPDHRRGPGLGRLGQRWYDTSTLSPKVRAIIRSMIAKAGRWLAAEHPEITEPGQWTRQTCAAWVAAVDRMRVGDYVQRHDGLGARAGTRSPHAPRPTSCVGHGGVRAMLDLRTVAHGGGRAAGAGRVASPSIRRVLAVTDLDETMVMTSTVEDTVAFLIGASARDGSAAPWRRPGDSAPLPATPPAPAALTRTA